jgi:Zn-dependent protease
MSIDIIFQIIILVLSVVVHEVSHGTMAYYLGDMTAKRAGRLTLNPLPHIDPMGSVILPALMVLSNSPILFGWAKPVPYNPYNLRKGGKWAEALVAFAGPASNFTLAILFGLAIRIGIVPTEALGIAFMAVYINVLLGIFNLIPIPPLDGSKILPSLLPRTLSAQYSHLTASLSRNPMLGFGFVILLVLAFGSVLSSAVYVVSKVIIGM